MKTATLSIRTDKQVKDSAEKILEKLGLNISQATNMFLRRVTIERGLPFDLHLPLEPNEVTKQAMRDIMEGKNLTPYLGIEATLAEPDDDLENQEWDVPKPVKSRPSPKKTCLSKAKNSSCHSFKTVKSAKGRGNVKQSCYSKAS